MTSRWVLVLVVVAASLVVSRAGSAEALQPWSADFPTVQEDVRAGRPLVSLVVVPLCSSAQIDCGSAAAGRPGSLEQNLYWGAIFGARRHFDRKRSGWT